MMRRRKGNNNNNNNNTIDDDNNNNNNNNGDDMTTSLLIMRKSSSTGTIGSLKRSKKRKSSISNNSSIRLYSSHPHTYYYNKGNNNNRRKKKSSSSSSSASNNNNNKKRTNGSIAWNYYYNENKNGSTNSSSSSSSSTRGSTTTTTRSTQPRTRVSSNTTRTSSHNSSSTTSKIYSSIANLTKRRITTSRERRYPFPSSGDFSLESNNIHTGNRYSSPFNFDSNSIRGSYNRSSSNSMTSSRYSGSSSSNNSSSSSSGSVRSGDQRDNNLSVVLLGAGEGGKATIYKQIQNMYNQEYESVHSRHPYISVIHHNTIMSMYSIVSYIRKMNYMDQNWNFNLTTRSNNNNNNPNYPQQQRQQQEQQQPQVQALTTANIPLEVLEKFPDCIASVRKEDRDKELNNLVRDISPETRDCFVTFTRFDDYEQRLDCCLSSELKQCIDHLWNNEPLIKFIYKYHRHERFQLHESAEYWFDNLERISQDDYVPTNEDIMRLRIKTTGVLESKTYEANTRSSMNMILMGSQRNERKKWLTIIRDRNLGAVIFVIALSEYNQTLYENDSTNRLHESICVFSEMMNSNCLSDVPVYLFLNKCDVFTDKLREDAHVDLSIVFPELPEELRKENLQRKGVHLIPKSYDSCLFVDWKEIEQEPLSIGTSEVSRISIQTKLVRTRRPTYEMLTEWKPSSCQKATSLFQKITDDADYCCTIQDLSFDEMGYVCSYLDVKDLCRLSQVNGYTYLTSGQDYIWRNLYYIKLLKSRSCFEDSIDNITITDQMVSHVYEEEFGKLELSAPTPFSSSNINDTTMLKFGKRRKALGEHVQMGKWKYFVKYTSQTYYQRNITFVLEELLRSTDRRDIKVFLTDATDTAGMRSILKNIIPEVALNNTSANQSNLKQKKHANIFSKIKNLFKR